MRKSLTNNHHTQLSLIAASVMMVVLLSSAAIYINAQRFHYPGNNYFPDKSLLVAITLGLLYAAARLQFNAQHRASQILLLMLAYYGVLSAIVLMTNAAQYTPFNPIDYHLYKFQGEFCNNFFTHILAWAHHHSTLWTLFSHIYNSLSYEIVVVPIVLICLLDYAYLYEYFFLLLVTALLGFTFYYFFPSIGPAYILPKHYFITSQLATGVKFEEIHQYLQPSTLEGGLIALPSFHVIWAWLSTYTLRKYRKTFYCACLYNAAIIFSCIFLGWHYFLDLLGSLVVLLLAHGLCIVHRATPKWCETRAEDHTCIN